MKYDYNELLAENEEKHHLYSQMCFNNIIQLFINYVDEHTKNVILEAKKHLSIHALYYFLYDYVFFVQPKYIDILFRLLKSFEYNFQDEIRSILVTFRDYDEETCKERFKQYEASPNINRIISKNGRLLIDSKLGHHCS